MIATIKTKKLGRPRMETDLAKAVVFHVRMTKKEREAIRQSARHARSESEWARAILLKNIETECLQNS